MQRVPRHLDNTHLLLGVCNPVTGQRHLLAPLVDTDPTELCCYAIITAADATNAAAGRYTFSQLLVATVELSTSNWAVHLHSYSAATRSWSAPATLNLVNGCRFSLVGQRSAVVHHGAAHWLWRYDDNDTAGGDDGDRALPPGAGARPRRDDGSSLYKLSVPLGAAAGGAGGRVCFAFTRIPVRGGGNPLLCVTGDGNLSVVCVYISHVDVSTYRPQQQAGHGHGHAEANKEAWEWERSTAFTIPAAVPYPDIPPLWQPKEKWFHLSKGSMLVLYRSSAVSIVDLHSKTMEKVMDCFLPLFKDQMNRTAVPYEMDLVDFFMLQLGGPRSTGSSG